MFATAAELSLQAAHERDLSRYDRVQDLDGGASAGASACYSNASHACFWEGEITLLGGYPSCHPECRCMQEQANLFKAKEGREHVISIFSRATAPSHPLPCPLQPRSLLARR